jgi:hypothetical protein
MPKTLLANNRGQKPMTSTLGVVALTLSLLISTNLHAEDKKSDVYVSDNELDRISVAWVAPKKFTDVKEANFSSSKFRKHVFNHLEKHLDKLAQDLPEGQKMSFEMTNLDLAGRVEPGRMLGLGIGMDDVRVMRDIDIPRIKFTYTVTDANGQVIKTEDVNLKDMGYLDSSNHIRRDRPFFYEKDMLSKWFKKEVLNANS